MNYIRKTIAADAVKGLPNVDPGKLFCKVCLSGKQTRNQFITVEDKRIFEFGEMIHVDTAGPYRIKSLSGAKFFLLMIDQASGMLTAYFMKAKSEAVGCIIDYISFLERQSGNKCKTIKSDGGTEFVIMN